MAVVSTSSLSRLDWELPFRLHVKWKEDSKAIIVLQSFQIEILLEVVKTGISNVGAIQETKSTSYG